MREAPDSSGEEWIGGEEIWATSDDCPEDHEDLESVTDPLEGSVASGQAVDDCNGIGETNTDDYDYEEWSQSSQSFKAMPLKDEEFERYYYQSNWTSEHITLLGERNNFTGPRLGYVPPASGPKPYSPKCFFNLFWPSSFLHKICEETNRYAGQRCTRRSDTRQRGEAF